MDLEKSFKAEDLELETWIGGFNNISKHLKSYDKIPIYCKVIVKNSGEAIFAINHKNEFLELS